MKEIKLSYDFYLLIPYYNNLQGLIRSLASVSYNPNDFAVLIVDDGSSHPLEKKDIMDTLPPSLSVTILRLEVNKGITQALNTGLQWITGRGDSRYVARLDCGDICSGERFYSQIRYMDAHPETDMVGSWCIFKNFETGWAFSYKTPTRHESILKEMHFKNVFRHSTVLWRSELTKKTGDYPDTFPHAEDYGFFYQILNKGHAAILPSYLVICEVSPDSISVNHRREQYKSRIRVVRQYGKNKLFSLIGVLKLRILLLLPYKMVLGTKRIIYGIKQESVI